MSRVKELAEQRELNGTPIYFFIKTPNLYLAKFFEAKGVQLAVDLTKLKENDTDALQAALNTLEDSQVADIEAEFQDVNARYVPRA